MIFTKIGKSPDIQRRTA